MAKNAHYKKLENRMHSAPFMKLTGAEAVIKKGKAEITLQVKEDFFHAAGVGTVLYIFLHWTMRLFLL